jgi:hypothetical protein
MLTARGNSLRLTAIYYLCRIFYLDLCKKPCIYSGEFASQTERASLIRSNPAAKEH